MNNLLKILKEKNIRQTDLARKLGVSRQRVFTWTKEINYPSHEYIKKISVLLDVPIEELFFNEDK